MGGPQPRIGLSLKVAQKQILTPGLVQMVSVLALNKLELREMINQEMIANPVLEELAEDYPLVEEAQQKVEAEAEKPSTPPSDGEVTSGDNHDSFQEIDFGSFFEDYLDPGYRSPASEVIEKPSFENFLSQPASLADHLEWQLSLSICPDEVREAGDSIIGNLNEDGYLTASLEEIAQSGEHKLEVVEAALALIQEFDPLGVAARDLRECLLIQLRALASDHTLAQQVVSDHLKQLQNKQYRDIARALDRPVKAVERCVELIRTLDPRPGQRYNKVQARLIEPDVAIVKMSEGYQVIMNEDGLPQLRLSRHYRRLLDESSTTREVRNYVKERFTSAIQLIKNIEQRKQTIVRVCEAIIRRQGEFLDKGIDNLRPMMIKEVAEEVGVHPSTVSRAVANKYAHTPQGVYELRFFFSEAVQGPSGASVSLINLKRLVKKMIEEEDSAHPLTDDQIAHLLRDKGICVTRRTVAKYREDMRIPSTHQRRVKA
ncbi:MAG: RNA polymerase factor sigma-54 [Acidobacteria bacterium]|nr:RNA polymerase factor sigma-54 [Acidobacteriota bacterium]